MSARAHLLTLPLRSFHVPLHSHNPQPQCLPLPETFRIVHHETETYNEVRFEKRLVYRMSPPLKLLTL